MKPIFQNPSADLSYLVVRYLFISSSKDLLSDRFVPDGRISLVFNFSSNVILIHKNKKRLLPPFFFVTPYIDSLKVEATLPYDTMVVVFRASVLSKIFNLSLDDLKDKPYQEFNPFGDIPLWKILKSKSSPLNRARAFEKILREINPGGNYHPDVIDQIYEAILSQGCKLKINKLLEAYEVNPRSFRRNFIRRIGINAKGLTRIARVNYIWDKIIQNPGSDLYNIMYECKFFDQSHFIKDFKNITGESPRSFFNRNLKQVKIISGKTISS